MSILDEIQDALPTAQFHGHYLSAVCPYHTSSPVRRSLMIYEDYFRCLSCNEQGPPEKLLRFLGTGNVILSEEETTFRNPWNSWLYNSTIEEVCKRAHRLVKDHPQQAQYWRSRGLTVKAIKKLKLGWLDGWNLIPVKENGKIVGAVARASDTLDSPAKYCSPSRKHQENSEILYVPSRKALRRSQAVFVTFGVISAITVYLAGFAACSPLTGKKCNPKILKDIRKPIIILPDDGEFQEGYKLANDLGWRGSVLRLPYHDKILDPADMWVHEKERLITKLGANNDLEKSSHSKT